jgi:uncharacterized protein with NRDE domain
MAVDHPPINNASLSLPKLIVTMNRDEAIDRLEGEPVTLYDDSGALDYWHPTDAPTGGTWFGVNGEGMVMALLNRYQDINLNQNIPLQSQNLRSDHSFEKHLKNDKYLSRGLIIPALLPCKSIEEVLRKCTTFDWSRYAPFDLFIFYRDGHHQLKWSNNVLSMMNDRSKAPFFYTSSSVDFEDAKLYRESVFKQFVENSLPNKNFESAANDAVSLLHESYCNRNRSLSINMRRPGRHTKSISQVRVNDGLAMHYWPLLK